MAGKTRSPDPALQVLKRAGRQLHKGADLFRDRMAEVSSELTGVEAQLTSLDSYFEALKGGLEPRTAFLAACQEALEGDDLEDMEAAYAHLLRVQEKRRPTTLYVFLH